MLSLIVGTIALPQGPGEFSVFLSPPGVQPLLKLVEDDEDLPAVGQPGSLPQTGNRTDQVEVGRQVGTTPP